MNRAWLSPFLVACTLAQAATVTPSATRAKVNESVSLTADRPVTWSLSGSGTLVVIDPQHARYTAPASIPAQHSYAGCLVAPNDSVFNSRVDSLPVHSLSAQWIAASTPLALSGSSTWGVSFADGNTPVYPLSFYYTTGNNGSFPIPKAPNDRQHGSQDASENDHHSVTLQRDNCQWFETYNHNPAHQTYTCRTAQPAATLSLVQPTPDFLISGLATGRLTLPDYPSSR